MGARRCMALVALVVWALALVGISPAGAQERAQPAGALHWSEPSLVDLAGTTYRRPLDAIACPTSSSCVAVDAAGQVLTSTDPSGSGSWHTRRVAGTTLLSSVSCPSLSLCVAVGAGGTTVATTHPDGAWHRPVRIAGGHDLALVGCPTVHRCLAVSAQVVGENAAADSVYVTDHPGAANPHWRPAGRLYQPAHRFAFPVSLACPTKNICVASDDVETTKITHDAQARTPSWVTVNGGSGAVSCVSGSLCVRTGTGATLTSTATIDPSRPHPLWHRVSSGAPTAAVGLSCTSTATCAIVDENGKVAIATNVSSSSLQFAPASAVVTPAEDEQRYAPAPVPAGVTCVSSSICLAIDDQGDLATTSDPVAAAPSWSAATRIDGGHEGKLTGVACVSTSRCIAVDGDGNALMLGRLSANDPVPSQRSAHVDAAALSGISCVAGRLCVAIDTQGDAVTTTNPAAAKPHWSAPVAIDPGTALTAISCTNVSFCIAGDQSGRVLISTDPAAASPSWSQPRAISPDAVALTGVACGSATLCYAVDSDHAVLASKTPTRPAPWTVSYTDGRPSDCPDDPTNCNGATDVSCPTAARCFVVSDLGDIVPKGVSLPPWRSFQISPRPDLRDGGNQPTPASIACPTTAMCVYAGIDGSASNAWDLGQAKHHLSHLAGVGLEHDVTVGDEGVLDGPLRRVACASASTCVAVDSFGELSVGNPGRRSPSPLAPPA